jgi:ribosomal protein S18 acetylase RimI-like enzyme
VTTLSKATEADIPQLSQLLNMLFTQETEFKPDECAQRRGLAMIVSAPDVGAILVARDGQSILAMVNLLFSVSTALGERVATLEDMIVAPSARGSGIGPTLLSYAIDFARESGVKRITLLTDHDNDAAQRFYSKHGFTKSSMVPLRLSVK